MPFGKGRSTVKANSLIICDELMRFCSILLFLFRGKSAVLNAHQNKWTLYSVSCVK